MGEFLDQLLGSGPPLVSIMEILGMIPGLREDLAVADPVAAAAALAGCRARDIPRPHRQYGHLLFGVAIYHVPTDREGAIRTIANVVGSAHGAPAFGSALGDVPVLDVAAVLAGHGFARTADAWVAASRVIRACEMERVVNAMVWDVPERFMGSDVQKCVGLHDCKYVGVDFAEYGERVSTCMPLALDIPGVPTYVSDFERAFGRGLGWGYCASPQGAQRLAEILTAQCGAPRAPRILGLAE